MTIAIVGDLHGCFTPLVAASEKADAVIQVGDLGYWAQLEPEWNKATQHCERIRANTCPLFFVDGNHDDVKTLASLTKDWSFGYTQVWRGLKFVSRGSVFSVDGRRVLFLGGSKSVDGQMRSLGTGKVNCWYPEHEQLTTTDARRALANIEIVGTIHMMVTHTPPSSIIRTHFPPSGLRQFGINPDTWVDESAMLVELVWNDLGRPPLYCGHMHRKVDDGNCHILGIEEILYV